MRCLSEFLSSNQVRQIIATCRESRAVQGILIDIDPLWMWAWRLGERFNPNNPVSGFEEFLTNRYARHYYEYSRFIGEFIGFPRDPTSLAATPWLPFRALTTADLNWRPPRHFDNFPWENLGTPVIMRICLYPQRRKERGTAPEFKAEGFRLTYEVRPIARLYFGQKGPRDQHRPLLGGVSIGVDSDHAGTLGGILKDNKGTYFGMTCAHVVGPAVKVEQPARIDKKGSTVATVMRTDLPPSFPKNAKRIASAQKNYAARVDAALMVIVEGGPSPKLEVLKLGRITDLVAVDDIAQGEELQLTGRSSDWQKVQRSSVSPFYNVTNQVTGDEYCFENPLIIREPSGGPAAKPGDSGAWVCKEVEGNYHWAAMVVGGDQQLGIAVSALELKNWWEKAGFNLSVC